MVKLLRLCESMTIVEKEDEYQKAAKQIWDIEVQIISYLDLYYDGNFKDINTDNILPEADIYRISWTPKKAYPMNSWLIYHFGILNKKRLLDPYNYHRTSGWKFNQNIFFQHYWFKSPKSLFFFLREEYKEKYVNIIEKEINYPLIAKDIFKDRWKGVFYIKDKDDLSNIIDENMGKWLLIQECIENIWEYRVITIGQKIITTFKRYNPKSYKNNTYKDTIFEPAKLDREKEVEIIDMVKKYGIEFAGIDILIGKDQQLYYLEINSEPQYQRTEKITGENILHQLFDYLKSTQNS